MSVASATVRSMPVRNPDPQRLLAAVKAQREALGAGPYTGPATADALGAACLDGVIAAADAALAPEREALRGAVVHTLGLLEARAPGRAVEVRIPPFAAVQCVAGQRHTRGTPPNLVETDALTWVLLAAGRTGWQDALASGSVHASGQRADLSQYLPLVTPRPFTGSTGQTAPS
jgi:uncharacterized SCP-like protein